jgi:hypothetical protein
MEGMSHDGMSHGGASTPSSASSVMPMMAQYLFSSKTGFYVLFRHALVSSSGGFVLALFASLLFSALTSMVFFLSQRVERGATGKRGAKPGTAAALMGATAHMVRWFMH